ncbi:hypothetical protein C8Q80DRAFT_861649 [Daedaleopsis nitida]|nr:hypothetical protein C8Q80DRAFT_861649 [Daedaleopsis nitida]
MAAPAKRSRRKQVKDGTSRQTSLLDVFSLRPSSKKSTPATSAAPFENGSTGGDDVIDIPSSDAEPMPELPADSSSPIAANDEDDLNEASILVAGNTVGQSGGSRDVPIVVVDSSPAVSPTLAPEPLPTLAPPPPPSKAVYSIFAPRKRPEERASSPAVYGKSSTRPSAPFPDALSQHVQGPQSACSVRLHQFSLRDTGQPKFSLTSGLEVTKHSSYKWLLGPDGHTSPAITILAEGASLDQSSHEQLMNSIPSNHRSYPAISRLLSVSPFPARHDAVGSNDANLLWNDKWRPKRADQVLGNEQSALYLRDWLLALKIHITAVPEAPVPGASFDKPSRPQKALKRKKSQGSRGTKRPRIIRDAERKRRRIDSEEPEDSWIAADDSDPDSEDPLDVIAMSDDVYTLPNLSRLKRFGSGESSLPLEPSSESNPEPAPTLPASDDVPPFSYTSPKFGDAICNTIVLTGPPGCGKTASIYACAEELGWDVFEVYPGIGERSGAALQKLIGEVGKNHLVKQTQHQNTRAEKAQAPHKAKHTFFKKRVLSDVEEDATSEQPADEVPSDEVRDANAVPAAAEVSQSIVLLEEVDVLYREDTNFWPTMIKIIKECRRPVVITCNDISMVPTSDLPIQDVLHFTPCPVSLAVSYLQALLSLEGRLLDEPIVRSLYRASSNNAPERTLDNLLHPRPLPLVPCDLRRTIHQLQLGASASLRQAATDTYLDEHSLELERLARLIELSSFADSGLRPPRSEVLRDILVNGESPGVDDLLGYKHLSAEPHDFGSHLPVTFSTYGQDTAILRELASFSQRHHPSPHDLLSDTPDLLSLHTSHCASVMSVLNRMRISREQVLRDPHAIFLDYEPWIRCMVMADDANMSAHLASVPTESTRRTRNSQRSELNFVRMMPLEDGERDILRRTAFNLDVDTHGPTDPNPKTPGYL